MIPIRWSLRDGARLRMPRDVRELRCLLDQARLYVGLSLHPSQRRRFRLRKEMAFKYVRGSGVEIGALHLPLPLPPGATVRYIDRMPVEALRKEYPFLCFFRLAEVSIVDDGERLGTVPDASVDFLIASHVIEHCKDPISTVESWLRVLRPGGILFLVVPDRRNRYDRHRPLTTLDHVVRDYTDGPMWSQWGHYEEHARLTLRLPEHLITAERIRGCVQEGYSIHQHIWTAATFRDMLEHGRRRFGLPLRVEAAATSFEEFIVIARRVPLREDG